MCRDWGSSKQIPLFLQTQNLRAVIGNKPYSNKLVDASVFVTAAVAQSCVKTLAFSLSSVLQGHPTTTNQIFTSYRRCGHSMT